MKTAFVTFKAKDQEAASQLKAALLQLKTYTPNETGIILYEIFQSEADALVFYVRESWHDQAAFEKHVNQPHLKKFAEDSRAWLTEPFSAVLIKTIG